MIGLSINITRSLFPMVAAVIKMSTNWHKTVFVLYFNHDSICGYERSKCGGPFQGGGFTDTG